LGLSEILELAGGKKGGQETFSTGAAKKRGVIGEKKTHYCIRKKKKTMVGVGGPLVNQ